MKKDREENKSKSIEEIMNEGFLNEDDINATFLLALFRLVFGLEKQKRKVFHQLKDKNKQGKARWTQQESSSIIPRKGQLLILEYQP